MRMTAPPKNPPSDHGHIRWLSRGSSCRIARAEWLDLAAAIPPASVDLVYADPPFNTGLTRRGRLGSFRDAFGSAAAHASWLRPRIAAVLPLLKPTGSILLHLDQRTSHHARLLLDELLGESHFVNHLIWSYGLGGSSPRRFARKHDDILFYAADPARYHFTPPMVPSTSRRMAGRPKKATDVLQIASINNLSAERSGYPTQKPLALLSMLVEACSPPGGTVLDPCCGSGTTLVAALRAGRLAIGGDVSEIAVRTALRRIRVRER